MKREDFTLSAAFVAPAGAMERRLTQIWESVFDIAGLGVEDDYFELGGESLTAVTLFTELEHVFGPMPPLSTLLDYPTIRKLAGRLEQLGVRLPESIVLTVQGKGRRVALFHLHAALGNVLFVRRLMPFLDGEQPLYAIPARGLQLGETPHRHFDAMAADYCAEIRRLQPKGPYLLAGHCVGGLIAYAMAQHLVSQGESVAGVVMIDPDYHPHAVPWLHWKNPSALHIKLWRQILRPVWFARLWLRRLPQRLRGRLPSEPQVTGLQRQRRAAVREGIRTALMAYRPKPHDGKVFIICSAERRRLLARPGTGWPSLAPQVEFIEISASHDEFFIGALPEVGHALETILAAIQPAAADQRERAAAE
jgi:thioesterase domain-containing protein